MKQSMTMMQQMQDGARYGDAAYLARYADCIFWMSRYLKRAETLARLLDVTQTFTPASRGAQNWQSILLLHDDEAIFASGYDTLSAQNVIRFYISDGSHANSILGCLQAARSNASQLRAVISTEMWVQINVMYNSIRDLGERVITPQELSGVLSTLRQQCQALSGIAQSGLYRDQGWYFYLLGRDLERADQTTRLLDIKYHLLLPPVTSVGSPIDASQWFALLRAASGYHAFRRGNPAAVTPATVAGFLLLDRRFPQSVAACIHASAFALDKLYQHYGLQTAGPAIKINNQLIELLQSLTIEQIITLGLHEQLDYIQLKLMRMSEEIAKAFF